VEPASPATSGEPVGDTTREPVGGRSVADRLAGALARLTDAQRAAVTAPAGPLWVEAGAGSGKTSVLTVRVAHRVATGTAEASHALVCTFTRRAATELAGRLAALGVPAGPPPSPGAPSAGAHVGTLHRVALHLVRRHAADRGRPAPTVGDRVRHLARTVPDELRDVVATEVAWARSRAIAPAAYAEAAERAERAPRLPLEQVATLFAAYDRSLARAGALDVDDLVVRAADLLEGDRRFGDAVRWRYRHLFVDELQDVTPAQFRLVVALLGPEADLTAVGDPNQAIYGWNGADPTLVASLGEHVAGLVTVRLDENHRSTPEIVTAAAAVLGHQLVGAPKSRRLSGRRPTLSSWADERAEADGVADVVLGWSAGRRWGDLAVLARTNDQLTVVEQALRRVGVPVRRNAGGARPDEDAVDVTTFHQAKGLEWWGVCAVGLEDGLVPISSSASGDRRAEERRLLYVALTRATDELSCSWARTRRVPGRPPVRRAPSPWLGALEPLTEPLAPGGPSPTRSAAVSQPKPSPFAGLRAILDGTAPLGDGGALGLVGQKRVTST
jgi:DNA helicase-2/ATP-dependent DNA helicase PcrA